MVKYYSPYCGHCQAFAPTWDTIVQETKESSPNPGIDFAEIDCTVYGGALLPLEILCA
jgi:thioredoxin domain-containing protein 5